MIATGGKYLSQESATTAPCFVGPSLMDCVVSTRPSIFKRRAEWPQKPEIFSFTKATLKHGIFLCRFGEGENYEPPRLPRALKASFSCFSRCIIDRSTWHGWERRKSTRITRVLSPPTLLVLTRRCEYESLRAAGFVHDRGRSPGVHIGERQERHLGSAARETQVFVSRQLPPSICGASWSSNIRVRLPFSSPSFHSLHSCSLYFSFYSVVICWCDFLKVSMRLARGLTEQRHARSLRGRRGEPRVQRELH